MTEISLLRLARLQKGLTLDELHLRSKGKLSPARVSRIERGLCIASPEEMAFLITVLEVVKQIVVKAGARVRRRQNN